MVNGPFDIWVERGGRCMRRRALHRQSHLGIITRWWHVGGASTGPHPCGRAPADGSRVKRVSALAHGRWSPSASSQAAARRPTWCARTLTTRRRVHPGWSRQLNFSCGRPGAASTLLNALSTAIPDGTGSDVEDAARLGSSAPRPALVARPEQHQGQGNAIRRARGRPDSGLRHEASGSCASVRADHGAVAGCDLALALDVVGRASSRTVALIEPELCGRPRSPSVTSGIAADSAFRRVHCRAGAAATRM